MLREFISPIVTFWGTLFANVVKKSNEFVWGKTAVWGFCPRVRSWLCACLMDTAKPEKKRTSEKEI